MVLLRRWHYSVLMHSISGFWLIREVLQNLLKSFRLFLILGSFGRTFRWLVIMNQKIVYQLWLFGSIGRLGYLEKRTHVMFLTNLGRFRYHLVGLLRYLRLYSCLRPIRNRLYECSGLQLHRNFRCLCLFLRSLSI